MPRILFIASHRINRSPSQRFRFEQYFSFLESKGYACELSFIISEKDDKIFYAPGHLVGKLLIFVRAFFKRFGNVLRKNQYDLVFIQREAFISGTTFFERQFSKGKAKVVFDFDDAIWNLDISDANKKFGWLKNPEKTADLIKMSDMIFAGNRYLADYALRYNKNVEIIPTTINTDEYVKVRNLRTDDRICIGWSGSITTIKHFEYALSFLPDLKKKYGDRICFKVIGDRSYVNEELGIRGIAWNHADEIKELSTFDIGIMPLPDDEWAKGKCGLKGLQYMALEIACIMSPVGVNTDIIQDGVNGFLAATKEEWIAKLSRLIEDAELRNSIGTNARKTVEERYSVNSQKHRYLELFQSLISG